MVYRRTARNQWRCVTGSVGCVARGPERRQLWGLSAESRQRRAIETWKDAWGEATLEVCLHFEPPISCVSIA